MAVRRNLADASRLMMWPHAVINAIEHDRMGEIILPGFVAPLLRLNAAAPWVARMLNRLLS
ncbi:MAG: type VI secretion system baseplate subunit TssK [Chloroflexaceae bacterium]|nr:type VI secretion system baseplate subunit TssK [Chloroflexaceae bacterium]